MQQNNFQTISESENHSVCLSFYLPIFLFLSVYFHVPNFQSTFLSL